MSTPISRASRRTEGDAGASVRPPYSSRTSSVVAAAAFGGSAAFGASAGCRDGIETTFCSWGLGSAGLVSLGAGAGAFCSTAAGDGAAALAGSAARGEPEPDSAFGFAAAPPLPADASSTVSTTAPTWILSPFLTLIVLDDALDR